MAMDYRVHALTIIPSEHRMIHDGMYFSATGIIDVVTATTGTVGVLFQFPPGMAGHLTLVEWTMSSGPVEISFYRDVTFSAAGSSVNVRNHNQLAELAQGVPGQAAGITLDPTITDYGTHIQERYVPESGKAGLLIAGEDAEWVLGGADSGHNFYWELANLHNQDIKVSFHFNGYEPAYDIP